MNSQPRKGGDITLFRVSFHSFCDISAKQKGIVMYYGSLKANLVLYQSCKYELASILNGDRALDRIQHGEGGGGGEVEGGGGTHVYGKNVRRALKLNNFADIGATDFIFASLNS